MDVSVFAVWVFFGDESIYELCKINHDRNDGGLGSTSSGDEW